MERRQKLIWISALTSTLVLHLIFRYYYTGGIWRAYDGVIFSKDTGTYISIFLKIILRLFIPPFNNPVMFSIVGAVAILFLTMVAARNRVRIVGDTFLANMLRLSVTGLFFTIIVAVSYGLSTRTSEGDRLLYFPSCFYAIMIAALITRLIRHGNQALVVFVFFVAFQVAFLIVNQRNWKVASEHASKVVNAVRLNRQRPLMIVNLPSDHKGAFIFRNCLRQALLHYNIDTTGIKIINVLQGSDADKIDDTIAAVQRGNDIFIWPSTTVSMKNGEIQSIHSHTTLNVNVPVSSVLYWNKENMSVLGAN